MTKLKFIIFPYSIILGRVPRPTYGLDVGECLSSFLEKYKFSCPKNEEITIFDMIHTIRKQEEIKMENLVNYSVIELPSM